MTQSYYECVYVFLLLFRKGMFGKLKKKKNKAEKGLILANKAAQGEVSTGVGDLTTTLGSVGLAKWSDPSLAENAGHSP